MMELKDKEMKALSRCTLLILMLVFSSIGYAQGPAEKNIQMLAKPVNGEIRLRWAPTDAVTWELAHKYGYVLEKYVLYRSGKRLEEAELGLLSESIFLPAESAEWERFIDEDDYVAIAAQAIYGETFELTNNYQNDIGQVMDKSKELESRFSFTVFSADLSFQAAQLAGLGYVDDSVVPDEKYVYRIYPNIPAHIQKVDTAYAFIGLSDLSELPVLPAPKVETAEHQVLIGWNTRGYEFYYSAYQIERSLDGEHFTVISEHPIADAAGEVEEVKGDRFYMDSIPELEKSYHFRIRGLSVFGEVGPPSESTEVSSFELMGMAPQFENGEEREDGSIYLKWRFDGSEKDMRLLKGFVIERGSKDSGPFYPVTYQMLGESTREYIDASEGSHSYYRVKAIGKHEQSRESFPYFVQRLDTISPAPPVEVIGVIDTMGIVHLSWKANAEPDLRGYRVYMANKKNDEFIQITTEIIDGAEYEDSIRLDNLTKDIYYKVVATDMRWNNSEFSKILKLTKPDIVPPVPPVINDLKADENGVSISWINSSSKDVVRHLLYRSIYGDQQWELIGLFDYRDDINSFVDTKVKEGIYYQYLLIAVDESGLESNPSSPATSKKLNKVVTSAPHTLKIVKDMPKNQVIVNWTYGQQRVERFEIYRSEGSEKLRFRANVEGQQLVFEDNNVNRGTTYVYRVRAVLDDGQLSPFSKQVEIAF